jgi:hypothetical protein
MPASTGGFFRADGPRIPATGASAVVVGAAAEAAGSVDTAIAAEPGAANEAAAATATAKTAKTPQVGALTRRPRPRF